VDFFIGLVLGLGFGKAPLPEGLYYLWRTAYGLGIMDKGKE